MKFRDAKTILESEGFLVVPSRSEVGDRMGLREFVVSLPKLGPIHVLFVKGDEEMMSDEVDDLVANARLARGESRPIVLTPSEWRRFEDAGMDMAQFVMAADRMPRGPDRPSGVTAAPPYVQMERGEQ